MPRKFSIPQEENRPLPSVGAQRDIETQRKEKLYDKLRSIRNPSETEVIERLEIAKELFGPNAQELDTTTATAVTVLEESIKARLDQAAPEETAQKLAEAERLVNRILAHRRGA